jgi:hypothetical protein
MPAQAAKMAGQSLNEKRLHLETAEQRRDRQVGKPHRRQDVADPGDAGAVIDGGRQDDQGSDEDDGD